MTDWKGEEITPENTDRIKANMDAEWQQYLKEKAACKKPEWMIDEHSTVGERLESYAITMPFKWQHIIEIEERSAQRCEELARILKNPEEKARWLKHADGSRSHAEEMRLKWGMIRVTANEAQKEIDKLA